MKKCNKCGNIKDDSLFYQCNSQKGKIYNSTYCKECNSIKANERYKEKGNAYWEKYKLSERYKEAAKKKLEEVKLSPRKRYLEYKRSARYRKHSFDLTMEEFESFWNKACVYCKVEIMGIGLDRIDNKFGYVVSNTVSCCGRCNRAKNRDSVDVFKKWIEWIKNN